MANPTMIVTAAVPDGESYEVTFTKRGCAGLTIAQTTLNTSDGICGHHVCGRDRLRGETC